MRDDILTSISENALQISLDVNSCFDCLRMTNVYGGELYLFLNHIIVCAHEIISIIGDCKSADETYDYMRALAADIDRKLGNEEPMWETGTDLLIEKLTSGKPLTPIELPEPSEYIQ